MSDLIKRENAIKAIDTMICDNKWVCECAINSLPSVDAVPCEVADKVGEENERLTDRIGQLEERMRWIPCSERLPKEKQEVYVTVYFTEGDTGRAYGYVDGFGRWHLYSTVEGTLNSGYEVTAWMPLPTPYREENEA